jgi:hypothetical protein
VNAKDFADFARRTAQPNMKSWGGNLNLWLPVPATVAEWEAKSIRFHEEQARRAAEGFCEVSKPGASHNRFHSTITLAHG